MSKWCHFFVINAKDPGRRECLLKPEFGLAIAHTVNLKNDLTVLSRHITDSSGHKKAHSHFESLLLSGKEASEAAAETIAWANEQWDKKSNSQLRLTSSAEIEERILKEARAEAALFTFFVMSGTSFWQIESQSLTEMFASFKWTHVPPSRTRFSTTLLNECKAASSSNAMRWCATLTSSVSRWMVLRLLTRKLPDS